MRKISLTILNAIKAYCKRVADLQQEMIEFQNEYEKELWKDKK